MLTFNLANRLFDLFSNAAHSWIEGTSSFLPPLRRICLSIIEIVWTQLLMCSSIPFRIEPSPKTNNPGLNGSWQYSWKLSQDQKNIYYNLNPWYLNCCVVFVVCLSFSSSYSQWSLCWVSSMVAPPGQWARQRQLWWGRCCTLTRTGSQSSYHPGPSGPRSGGWPERCPTGRRKRDKKIHNWRRGAKGFVADR